MLSLSRRRLLLSGAAAGAAPVWAPVRAASAAPTVLRVERRGIDVGGRAAQAYAIRQPDGTAGLTLEAGGLFDVALENRSGGAAMIHWHGLTPPWRDDGVAGVSQDPLPDGADYTYRFPVDRPGTYWMHSHYGLAEQQLMAAPLIIHDPAERGLDEQEVVILLHDFSFRDPAEILAGLQGREDAGAMAGMQGNTAMAGMQHGDAMAGMDHGAPATPGAAAPAEGAPAVAEPMAMPEAPASTAAPSTAAGSTAAASTAAASTAAAPAAGGMAGMAPDINDVDYDAYLANDRTLADPEIVAVERGGKVRLRIINAASSTNFFVDLGALEGDLVATDGQPVVPIRDRRFPVGIAQRVDIRLTLPGVGAFPILAQREGDRARTGVILATPGAAFGPVAAEAGEAAGVLGYELERTLRAAQPLAERHTDRVIEVALTGDMAKYIWTLDGLPYATHPPLMVRTGERVELVLRNETGMSHPMHLHGHIFQVVALDGARFPGARRDTVVVPGKATATIAFDADNPGRWAFHCHNLYHQAAGMMTTLDYQGV